MKKLLSVLLAALMIVCVFAGCSSDKANVDSTENNTSLPAGQVTTENATLKSNDAIHYIEDSYTLEELGLADAQEEFSFMAASNGFIYDGDNYIKIVANVVTQNEGVTAEDGSKTFSLKAIGEYLISFDGKKVLMKDMSTEDTYTELENRISEYNKNKENKETASAAVTEAE